MKLNLIVVATVVLALLWPMVGSAVSLLRVESNSIENGELLTLRFDEDVVATLSGSASRVLRFSTGSPIYNDASSIGSEYVTSIEQDGNTLILLCSEPVTAELRRAGAGIFLLLIQPTGIPVKPEDSERQSPVESSPEHEPESIHPSAEDLLVLARLHTVQERYDKVRETVELIPEDSDQYAWGQLVLGEMESRQGNDRAAASHYQEAMKHEHTEAAAATNLALYHQKRGDSEKSQQMWERVLALGDAGVSSLNGGEDGGPESDSEGLGSSDQNERTGSNVELDSNSKIEFFDSTFVMAVALFLIVGGGVGTGFMMWQKKRAQNENPEDADTQGNEVFWDTDDVVGEGQGTLAEELERKQNEKSEKASSDKEIDISEETRQRLVEMHKQSNSIREMAEITGMSQDIIRMALQMEGVSLEE